MSYQVRGYTLPPGQTVTINIVGTECAVYEATKDFQLSHDDLDPQYITGGMKLKPKNGFESIVMLNPHDEPVTVKLGITDGQIEDNRLSTSAPVQVSEIQTPVGVADPDTGASFSDLNAAIIDVNSKVTEVNKRIAEQIQSGSVALSYVSKNKIGTSFLHTASVSTTALVIIDPAVNANGAILRQMTGHVGASTVIVYAGASPPADTVDLSKQRIAEFYSFATPGATLPLFLPAGVGLYSIGSGSGSARHSYSWDYL